MKLLLFLVLTAIVCSTSAMKLHNSYRLSAGNYGIPLIVIYLFIIQFLHLKFQNILPLLHIAVRGLWSDWQQWGSCSATCGVGHRIRTRECNRLKPRYGECDGTRAGSTNAEYEICSLPECIGKNP